MIIILRRRLSIVCWCWCCRPRILRCSDLVYTYTLYTLHHIYYYNVYTNRHRRTSINATAAFSTLLYASINIFRRYRRYILTRTRAQTRKIPLTAARYCIIHYIILYIYNKIYYIIYNIMYIISSSSHCRRWRRRERRLLLLCDLDLCGRVCAHTARTHTQPWPRRHRDHFNDGVPGLDDRCQSNVYTFLNHLLETEGMPDIFGLNGGLGIVYMYSPSLICRVCTHCTTTTNDIKCPTHVCVYIYLCMNNCYKNERKKLPMPTSDDTPTTRQTLGFMSIYYNLYSATHRRLEIIWKTIFSSSLGAGRHAYVESISGLKPSTISTKHTKR